MERVVEVLALSALLQASAKQKISNNKEVRKLKQFAFPEEINLDKQYDHHFQETVYCCGDDDCEGGCEDDL
jgi:hypothetical protein